MADVYVLGLSMSRHDRAACLVKNGAVSGAIAEERLDRRKRSLGALAFRPRGIVVPPLRAMTYLLRQAGIPLERVDLVVCGRSMTSCRETVLDSLPFDHRRVVEPPIPGHHLAHAYSAYATSPFAECAVLVVDEQGHHIDGRFEKCTWLEGDTGPLRPIEAFFGGGDDLSLGMFYNACAAMAGLSEADTPSAGKLMGLAALGKPHPEWPQLVALKPGGDTRASLRELDAFLASTGLPRRMPIDEAPLRQLEDLPFYVPARWDTQLGADLARKAQDELERALLHIAGSLRERSSADALCYAGGVALNCTMNRRLLEAGWKDVFVHPAATDDGNAVGLAMYGWIECLGHPRTPLERFSPFTGRAYPVADVRDAIAAFGLQAFSTAVDSSEAAAERAAKGEVVCWFEGGSEWGPRALGARSVVASPLLPGIRERINSTIKFREPFRPLAISATDEGLAGLVARDEVASSLAPYMLAAGRVIDDRLAPVRHLDGTVRYQIVSPAMQPAWHALIEAFGRRTGVCAVLNTSFNTLGEPLVETPMDAVRLFLLSGADALVAQGVCLARKDISIAALTRAVSRAWAATPIDPLGAACSLEDAGYGDAALRLLDDCRYSADRAVAAGAEACRRYHALRLRASVRDGDLSAARRHADAILHWSSLPPEAIDAARVIAADPRDPQHQIAGRLIGGLAMPGGALRLLGSSVTPASSLRADQRETLP
ncbi:MAG: carbamoyltransferase C-terminal domain-containing protein [Acidobacteriota bacterium]